MAPQSKDLWSTRSTSHRTAIGHRSSQRGSDSRFDAVKITDIRPIATYLSYGYAGDKRASIFILVDTDEGITGVGEATNFPSDGSYVVRDIVVRMRRSLIGQNPFDIDRIWHQLYRRYTYLGSRGAVTAAISGIDIALWDIKGKALGCPVYDLLGGRFREDLDLYANSWFGGCSTPEDFAAAAQRTVALGYTALKFDPFAHEMQQRNTGYVSGQISPAGEELGIAKVAAVRESVGGGIDLWIRPVSTKTMADVTRRRRSVDRFFCRSSSRLASTLRSSPTYRSGGPRHEQGNHIPRRGPAARGGRAPERCD